MATDVDTATLDSAEKQMKFVSIVKDFPIILEKSGVPHARKERTAAILKIKEKVKEEMDIILTENQIFKKISNMKSRIKKKLENHTTSNKKIILKDWEIEFLKFLEGESIPAINKIEETMKGDVMTSHIFPNDCVSTTLSEEDDECNLIENDSISELVATSENNSSENTLSSSSKTKKRAFYEDDETKDLSLQELKRLVLLQQLKYFKKAEQLMDMKIRYARQNEDKCSDKK